jgi:hypothetical protein
MTVLGKCNTCRARKIKVYDLPVTLELLTGAARDLIRSSLPRIRMTSSNANGLNDSATK